MNKIKKVIPVVILVIMLSGIMTGCGVDDIDISGYEKETVSLVGIDKKPVKISVKELKALDCVTVTTESTSDKIGEVRATGPLLTTVLEKYGADLSDYSKIVLHGTDQYDVKLLKDYLAEHDLMLAFGIDGKPLDEESKPVRLIIEDSDSAYWIRMINKIEFVK